HSQETRGCRDGIRGGVPRPPNLFRALREAQADGRRALSLLEEADTESHGWGARNAEALVANLTSPYTGHTGPVPPDDPGESLRRQAGTVLAEAKGRVAAAATHAAARLHTA